MSPGKIHVPVSACLIGVLSGALVLAAAAPKVNFISRSSFVERGGMGERVEVGTVGRVPAERIDGIVIEKNGLARTWDEARAACQNLKPEGAWDLPLTDNYMALIMNGAVNVRRSAMEMGVAANVDRADIYPMWARDADEAQNKKEFSGRTALYVMEDGHADHEDIVGMSPVSAARAVQKLAAIDKELADHDYQTPQEENRDWSYMMSKIASAQINAPLPPDIKAIERKPMKADLLAEQLSLRSVLSAYKYGYPIYCAANG